MQPTATLTDTMATPLRLGAIQLGHRVFFTSQRPLLGTVPGTAQWPPPSDELAHPLRGRLVLCTLSPTQVLWRTGGMDSGLGSAQEVNRWRGVTEAIRAGGGVAVARLGNTLVNADSFPDMDQLDEVLDAYRTAAENAGDAGFDGVELIGTTGSLPARLLCAASEMAATLGVHVDRPLGMDFLAGACQALLGTWPADRVGLSLTLPRNATQWELVSRALRAVDAFELAFLHLTSMGDLQSQSISSIASRLRPLFRGGLVVSGEWNWTVAEAAILRGDVEAVAFARDRSQVRSITPSRAEQSQAD